MYGMVSSEKLKIDIVFPHYMLGEIPIDSSFIISPVVMLGSEEIVSYLLGDLTSSTRSSKSC